MIKRLLDIIVSAIGLIVTLPVTLPVTIAIWLQDFHSPFYVAERVGKNFRLFSMIKFRSMVVNADKIPVDSTSSVDPRITAVGRFVRKFKLDEFSQLVNVLIGDMSLVGPRPQVRRNGTDLYTDVEKNLLNVKPGITDISSIVFSDEGDILKDSSDANRDYDRLIRPWKSRLGLLYVEKHNLFLDIALIALTAVAIVSKKHALIYINRILVKLDADPRLIEVCKRESPLYPYPPPGSDKIS